MVPTSRSTTPAASMIWGSRNSPPISISSPRETSTSRPRASPPRASSSAPAALLTTSAASAPVASRSSASAAAPRRPRVPAARSYSTAAYPAASATAALAAADSGARPRLVWSTTPVALTTARVRRPAPIQLPGHPRRQLVHPRHRPTTGHRPPADAPAPRRAAPSTDDRPNVAARSTSSGCPSSTSMFGSSRRGSSSMPPLSTTTTRRRSPTPSGPRTIQGGPRWGEPSPWGYPLRTIRLSDPTQEDPVAVAPRPLRRWCCCATGGTGRRRTSSGGRRGWGSRAGCGCSLGGGSTRPTATRWVDASWAGPPPAAWAERPGPAGRPGQGARGRRLPGDPGGGRPAAGHPGRRGRGAGRGQAASCWPGRPASPSCWPGSGCGWTRAGCATGPGG